MFRKSTPDTSTATVLGYPRSDMVLILVGMPLVGMILAFLLPIVARQALRMDKLPFRTVFKFLGSAEETWQVLAFMGGGLVLGLFFAFVSLSESLKVTLTDARIEVANDKREERFDRADVSAAFMDGKHLVVLDQDSRQLVRGTHAAPAQKLAHAFQSHGYPWQDSDPYADLFHAWVPGSGEPRPEVNAILVARKEALKRKSEDDVRELTQAAEDLGYTIRDKGSDQFWRPLVKS